MYDKKRPVYFVFQPEIFGEMVFTFNGEKLYNLFKDYPYALTAR